MSHGLPVSMCCRRRLLARPLARSLGRKGVAAVEFALLATAFMTLVLLTMEVCYGLVVGAALDYGAHAASRFGITGATAAPGSTGTDRSTALQTVVIQSSGGLLSSTHLQMSETSFADFPSAAANAGGTSGPGSSRQVVMYTLTYTQPYLLPISAALMGSSTLIHKSTAVVLNEPY